MPRNGHTTPKNKGKGHRGSHQRKKQVQRTDHNPSPPQLPQLPLSSSLQWQSTFPAMRNMFTYHNRTVGGENLLPSPRRQRGSSCHYHASVNCLEIRLRQASKGQDIPRLSVQHGIDAVEHPEDVLGWLESHGVTTEKNIGYDGLKNDANAFVAGMAVHKLAGFVTSEKIRRYSPDNSRIFEDMKMYLRNVGPMIVAIELTTDFQLDGKSIYTHTDNVSYPQLHCVVLVGYGVPMGETTEYWIYLNSEGPQFGYDGLGIGLMAKNCVRRTFKLQVIGENNA